jgi:7-cyano-7-deazaguanine reductase
MRPKKRATERLTGEVRLTEESDLTGLTLLGKGTKPQKKLETFPNHHPERNYIVTLKTDEFTCVCPATGQPDFAKLVIQYIPDKKIVESKSMKLYLWSYRNEGVFHEHVANVILDDLIKALQPRWCKVTAEFNVRGGISISVEAEHGERMRS